MRARLRIFIIGIAGGVGRRLAEQLADAGDEPVGLVRRPEQAEALAATGIRTVRGDLGLARFHTKIARDDVAATIVELLRSPGLKGLILELTGGDAAIRESVGALSVHPAKHERIAR